MERAEAEAIYDQGREVVVAVLLRMDEQIGCLERRVAARDERIAQLERRVGRSSRTSSQPPSSDPPDQPVEAWQGSGGRKQGAQDAHEGKGRPLLPAWTVDEVVEHWPADRGCGHVFDAAERVSIGQPARHQQVEELPVMAGCGIALDRRAPRLPRAHRHGAAPRVQPRAAEEAVRAHHAWKRCRMRCFVPL
ncbi:MAG: DUF6444 domain-containing protein [Solirubrobacteraceae bacterium]